MEFQTIILCALLIFTSIIAIVLHIWAKVANDNYKLCQAIGKQVKVQELLALLENVRSRLLLQQMRPMLVSYFELCLPRFNYRKVPSLLDDLGKSKHSAFLLECLAVASLREEDLFGKALASNLASPKRRLAIEKFVEHLPRQHKVKVYEVAINHIETSIKSSWFDYPPDFKKIVNESLVYFEAKIA